MKALYVEKHTQEIANISIKLIDTPMPSFNKQECLIKVVASGINPSDVLATMGYFQHARLPRIPGRDFAGTIVDGPNAYKGKHVWGTGGGAGISFNGTQAEYIKLPLAAIAEIPNNFDLITAGAQPLPYVTAYHCLVERALIEAGETILIVGALGQVGQAAMSISQWKKCTPIALVRGKEEVEKATQLGWKAIASEEKDLGEMILAANNGKPIQVILNTLGNLYWQAYLKSLSEFGRIVTIGARENTREVTVNLLELYRANQSVIGVNTITLDYHYNAKLLNELKVGFEKNLLIPLAVDRSVTYSLDQASHAYQKVMESSGGKRVVIQF